MLASVASAQNATKPPSQEATRSMRQRSSKSTTGSATLNTKPLARSANSRVTSPTRLRKYPSIIMRKMGSVALRLKMRSSMRLSAPMPS